MTEDDADVLSGAIAGALEDYHADTVKPLLAEIAALKATRAIAGPKGDPGEPGAPGTSVTIEELRGAIHEAALDAVDARVKSLILPKGEQGEPGPKGEAGSKGDPGAPAHPDTTRVMVSEEVAKAVAALPRPDNGRDADPIVMAKMVTDEVARQFDLVRPHIRGEKGDKGLDGFSVDDLSMELGEDGRTLTLKFTRGDVVKSHELVVPWPIDRGVWKPESEYAKGDGATYNGSFWIAQDGTKDRPGTSRAWRLAVKAGRDLRGEDKQTVSLRN